MQQNVRILIGQPAVIIKAYERLFVAFYAWSLKVDGNRGGYNVCYATIMLSLTLILNIASIAMIVDLLTPRPFLLHLARAPRIWWVLCLIAFMALHYLYFRHDDRYRKAIAEYGPNEDLLAKGPHWKLIAYMMLSLILVIGIMVWRLT